MPDVRIRGRGDYRWRWADLFERISGHQLTTLLSLFLLGSAWLFVLGVSAEPDVWIANLISTAAGLALVAMYLYMQSRYPKETLVQFLPRITGKVVGKLLGLAYILYFLYEGARVTRDFGELAVTTLLPGTPISVVIGIQVLLIAYCLRHGPEVLARVSEVLLPIAAVPLVGVTLLVLSNFRFSNLLPIMGRGPGPLLAAAFPLGVTVPYGETIVFLMLWPLVTQGRARATVRAEITAGLLLAYLSIVTTAVLGTHLATTSQFPLLEVVRHITVSDVLDRIDAVAALVMTLGGFTKVAVFLYAATAGLAQWLGLAEYRPLILPMTTILLPLAITIAPNYPDHILIGLKLVPSILHIPFQIVIPMLLALIVLLRQWLGAK